MSEQTRKKKTWERRTDDAKKKHRTSLKDWAKDRFAYQRYIDFLALRTPIQYSSVAEKYRVYDILHLDANELSVETFLNQYERLSQPVVISNIPKTEGWKAYTEDAWSWKTLDKKYRKELFKCGEDDDGYKINIKLKYFLEYLRKNKDDSPLYIFDSNFADLRKVVKGSSTTFEPKVANDIEKEFQVPRYFPYDLFSLVGEKRRPPYRWFLVGPERSGSTMHIDPLGTSAWNTLISGRKKWILFPPYMSKSLVKGLDVIKKGEDDEAINYFVDIYPRIKEKYLRRNSSDEYKDYYAIEFIQEAGETIFVPSGWWHTVLNLDDTVAITQNYCSYNNFEQVWRITRKSRKKMSVKFLEQLRIHHPTLYEKAIKMNEDDQFVMYNAAEDKDKKKKKKKNKKNKKEQKENKEKIPAAVENKSSTTTSSNRSNTQSKSQETNPGGEEEKKKKKRKLEDTISENHSETSHEARSESTISISDEMTKEHGGEVKRKKMKYATF